MKVVESDEAFLERLRSKSYVVDFGNSNSTNPNRREFLNLYTKAKNDDERFVIEEGGWTESEDFKVGLTGNEICEYLAWKSGADMLPVDHVRWFVETFCKEVAE